MEYKIFENAVTVKYKDKTYISAVIINEMII